MRTPEIEAIARQAAERHGIRREILLALIEQESGWNEYAVRYEPAFMSKYISPLFLKGQMTPTEAYSRAMSWGLCQVMGQTAREQGFSGHYLSELCAPINGIEQGCIKLAACLKRAGGDESIALLHYNGGGQPGYPAQVLARIDNYKEIT